MRGNDYNIITVTYKPMAYLFESTFYVPMNAANGATIMLLRL